MTLEQIDLHTTDEDELAALIDDACDNGKAFVIVDSDDLDNPGPLAVVLPWDRYETLVGIAVRAETVEPHLGKATQTP